MNKKTLVSVISAASLLIMFIWGYADSFQHSWLAIFAGGIAIAAVNIADKNRDENGKIVYNAKTLSPIISMTSVLVMFIWGYLEGSFQHSWLAVMAGGMLSGILWSSSRKEVKEKDQKEQ